MMASHDLKELSKALQKYDRFLLSCHVLPEGDAIGSMLAMESLLRRLGKKTQVVCQDPFPERLDCLSRKRWKRFSELNGKKPPAFDAVIITDCPTLERIGDVKELITPGKKIFNIDHHVSNTRFGDYNYIRPEAAATAEVVFDIFKHLKVPVNKEDATNLYVALATDTGSFKYSNTTAKSHLMASELIGTGIPIETLNNQLHGTYSPKMLKLYGRLFTRVKTAAGRAIAWAGMCRGDLDHSGASYEDAEGFIDFLRYLRDVKIAFFMSELEKNVVRVSFRAVGPYDVNRIATHFKGGGHKKAAGCILRGTSLRTAEKAIVAHIKNQYRFDARRKRVLS